MSKPSPSLLAALRAEFDRLREDLRRMVAARWQLAELETRVAAAQMRRCAVGVATGGLLVIVALPLMLVALAEAAAAASGWSRTTWLLLLGGGTLVAGVTIAALSVSWFRRRFAGWEETAGELREDLLWLREWLGSDATAATDAAQEGDDGPQSPPADASSG